MVLPIISDKFKAGNVAETRQTELDFKSRQMENHIPSPPWVPPCLSAAGAGVPALNGQRGGAWLERERS